MDLLDLEIILSTIGTFTAAGGLIFNALSYRAQARAQNLQVITDFDHEFTKLEASQERNEDYDMFAAKYLNVGERVAFLSANDIIPADMARYFDDKFRACLGILEKDTYAHYRTDLPSLLKWCEERDLKPRPAPEPYKRMAESTSSAPP